MPPGRKGGPRSDALGGHLVGARAAVGCVPPSANVTVYGPGPAAHEQLVQALASWSTLTFGESLEAGNSLACADAESSSVTPNRAF